MMSIKKRANELIAIAKKIAEEKNIDLEDYSEANKSKVIGVWSEATKEFETVSKKSNN